MQIFQSNVIKSAIIGIYILLLMMFVVVGLYIGSVVLIPIALAILLSFLLTPLVSRLERVLGRVVSVVLVLIMTALVIGITSYVLSKELIQFATNIPLYKTNIDIRTKSLREYTQNISNFNLTINELKNKISGGKTIVKITPPPGLFDFGQTLKIIGYSFIYTVGTTLLVLLLVSFILIEREDLRGRFIRLIGQERLGATTSAINDASLRVSHYLRMLLVVNASYGILVSIGLYFLGIPNALLWGALSGLLRFVPYVGVWIAAAIPIALSFAITSTWILPVLTISLFVILEAFISNILEPWYYGTGTGVSATALIIAAIFWTFLWGPIGLILSTPITVCLVVLGRHVPRLEFLSILLSDEEPLTPYEEFYYRLLVANTKEIMNTTDDYLKENSIISLYDNVLIPVIARGEIDIRKEKLDDDQIHVLYQNLEDLIEDLNTRSLISEKDKIEKEENDKKEKGKEKEKEGKELIIEHKEVIMCISAKAKRDELVGEMLTQLLRKKMFIAINAPLQLKIEELINLIKNNNPKIVIISIIPPSNVILVRYIIRNVHSNFPKMKIIVGLWGEKEKLADIKETLKNLGVDEIVTSLADAISYIEKNGKSEH